MKTTNFSKLEAKPRSPVTWHCLSAYVFLHINASLLSWYLYPSLGQELRLRTLCSFLSCKTMSSMKPHSLQWQTSSVQGLYELKCLWLWLNVHPSTYARKNPEVKEQEYQLCSDTAQEADSSCDFKWHRAWENPQNQLLIVTEMTVIIQVEFARMLPII